MSFKEKVILITGAGNTDHIFIKLLMIFKIKHIFFNLQGSGIGAQTAKHFAKLRGRLAIVDFNFDRINKVAEEIIDSGAHTPLVIVADVNDDAEHIISETIEHFSKLDILVNNVGIVVRQNLSNIDMDVYDRVMNTNVRSVVDLTRLAVPHLEITKGNIINISSAVGILTSPQLLAYSMTKAAINAFTKCIATELGRKGIRVNAILPGVTNTGDTILYFFYFHI